MKNKQSKEKTHTIYQYNFNFTMPPNTLESLIRVRGRLPNKETEIATNSIM